MGSIDFEKYNKQQLEILHELKNSFQTADEKARDLIIHTIIRNANHALVEYDGDLAVEFYKTVADFGDTSSMINTALCYEEMGNLQDAKIYYAKAEEHK